VTAQDAELPVIARRAILHCSALVPFSQAGQCHAVWQQAGPWLAYVRAASTIFSAGRQLFRLRAPADTPERAPSICQSRRPFCTNSLLYRPSLMMTFSKPAPGLYQCPASASADVGRVDVLVWRGSTTITFRSPLFFFLRSPAQPRMFDSDGSEPSRHALRIGHLDGIRGDITHDRY